MFEYRSRRGKATQKHFLTLACWTNSKLCLTCAKELEGDDDDDDDHAEMHNESDESTYNENDNLNEADNYNYNQAEIGITIHRYSLFSIILGN